LQNEHAEVVECCIGHTSKGSKGPKNFFLVDPLRGSNRAEYRVERPYSQRLMIWDCYPMVGGRIGLKDDVTANLMNAPVAVVTAQSVN